MTAKAMSATSNLVITITGTNDVPVIDSATNPTPAVVEVANDSSAQNIPQQNGTISITDQDLGDTLTVTVKGDATASYKPSGGAFGALPVENSVNVAALIASGAVSFDPAISNGEQVVINWHYDPAAADLDWLRQGDTLTITYLAQVNDGQGNVGNQQLVITITGTNDVPSFSSVTNPADIFEIAGNSSAQDIPQQNGTIGITDQDLGDPLTVTVNAGNATALYNGVAVPAAFASKITALVANGAISFDPATSNGEEQTVNWHYNPGPADLDWLAQGDTLTITYVAHVNDGHGVVGSQNLVITIKGTNDAPVIKYTGSYSFDQFNTQDYGGWVEVGNNSNGAVNGNPLDGEFQIAHDPITAAGDFQIRLTDLDAESDIADTLTRTFNLVGAGNTAKVEFDYRRDIPSGQSNDHFDVLVSINGGTFTSIGQYRRNRKWHFVDQSYTHFTLNLSHRPETQ